MSRKPYGIICPITHAVEFLEPRWTIQILSEMWGGSSRFNDIRRGVGDISPGLLSRRLKEMEAKGLIERVESKVAGTVDYVRTPMAIDLEPALNALAEWAQCNIEAEVAICEPNLSALMWKMRRLIAKDVLPRRRVVLRFHFQDATTEYDTYWIVTEPGSDIDICTANPKLDVDLFLETTAVSLTAIILGRSTIARERESGKLFLSGDPVIARTMDRWLPASEYGKAKGVVPLGRSLRAVC